MRVEVKTSQSKYGYSRNVVLVDDKKIAHIQDLSESPEDAIIGRDLIDGNDIVRYIEMGYAAAKRGEELLTIYTEGGEDD